MTIPINQILPTPNKIFSVEDVNTYVNSLTEAIRVRDEQIVNNLNGNIKNSMENKPFQYIPIIVDSVNDTITFTYDHQTAWTSISGIFVDYWFDIEWTSASAALTGNMIVRLPYKTAMTDDMPFVGVIQAGTFAFTAGTYCTINAVSNSFNGEIWNSGSGIATVNQASVSAGRIIGHIRYIGQQYEK